MTTAVKTVTRQVTLRELESLFEQHDFNSFPVVEDGKLLTADVQQIIREANEAVPDLFRRRADWLATHESVNELVQDKDDSH